MMQTVIALALSGVFVVLAVLHGAWGLGFKWGGIDFLPQNPDGTPLFNPGVVVCFAAGAVFALAALVFALRAGIFAVGVPAWVPYGGVWCIAAVLLLRAIGDFRYAGLTKKIRDTSFARKDTRIYTPFCLVMAALCIVVQVL